MILEAFTSRKEQQTFDLIYVGREAVRSQKGDMAILDGRDYGIVEFP